MFGEHTMYQKHTSTELACKLLYQNPTKNNFIRKLNFLKCTFKF